MTFLLAADRQDDPKQFETSFTRYREYLQSHQGSFPSSAYELATSDWYFTFSDPRAPHDAQLRDVRILENEVDEQNGRNTVAIQIRLLNARHDRLLEFTYPAVLRYTLDLSHGAWGHRDWRYDEFRLSDDGLVIHEIEWAGPRETARWVIVASDVVLSTRPL
jgi:hypothetical protein